MRPLPEDDLVAILLTGIPSGIIPGFQNYTGSTLADVLRLNMAIPPSSSPNIKGILGGDLAGYPNGRRVADDVVTIELRAIAGLTYQVVHGSDVYTADAAAGAIYDVVGDNTPPVSYLSKFPYLNPSRERFRRTRLATCGGGPGATAGLSSQPAPVAGSNRLLSDLAPHYSHRGR